MIEAQLVEMIVVLIEVRLAANTILSIAFSVESNHLILLPTTAEDGDASIR